MNFSFLLCLAAIRTRSSACDTLSRSCARRVLCWPTFPLVSVLGSTNSAADRSALFVGFPATTTESDSSGSCIIGYDLVFPMRTRGVQPQAKPEASRLPRKELPHMPGSSTTPSRAGTRDFVPVRVAFRHFDNVGTRDFQAYAAPWLARAFPYRRFAVTLAGADARLGADEIATPSPWWTCTSYSLPVCAGAPKLLIFQPGARQYGDKAAAGAVDVIHVLPRA